ncbi:MAG TPA: CHAT domain-containing protein, partial [Candidatus Eisenbacteria bacterium]|nr:CHAT domain-containing protein [Candidatus Eisenbacteria bacterium]
GHTNTEGNALLRQWGEAHRRVALLAVQGAPEDDQDFVKRYEEARREADSIEREVGRRVYSNAVTSAQAGAREICRALPDDTALVSYARAGQSYVAFVLTPHDSIPEFLMLGSAEEIDSSISRWMRSVWGGMRRAGTNSERECREAGKRVRSLVFDPVRTHLGRVRRVLVVPDGSLYQVNFYALPYGATSYLVESGVVIHELTCERDLVDPSAPSSGEGALIVGGPDYDWADSKGMSSEDTAPTLRRHDSGSRTSPPASAPCPDLSELRFQRLPGSRREAEEVAAMVRIRSRDASLPGRVMVLTGSNATEEAVKRTSPGKPLLHFATHGFYLGECRSAPGTTRAFGATVPSRRQRPAFDRPLLLSGLALAGANRRSETPAGGEDGILTAEEIACMNLTATGWAVLSGCETGLGGQQRNEGIVGLRRAFRIAGVRTLILSLWPVEDQAARVWMRSLYEARWIGGRDTAEAVRDASLQVLRELRAQKRSTHPWYWASFVASGDWD